MKDIEQYYNGFFLKNDSSNSKLANFYDKLRVAPIKSINSFNNITIDKNHYVFAGEGGNGNMIFFHGLNNFFRIYNKDTNSIYIFDNHNHALFFWYFEILKNNLLGKNIELIHIDQHSDCRTNNNELKLKFSQDEVDSVFDFTNNQCNVGNFIPPALKSGLITSQKQIRSLISLQQLKINNNQNFILDIDLDFCLSGLNRKKIDKELIHELKIKFNNIAPESICITIATSPYFLDQNLAIDILNYLLKN